MCVFMLHLIKLFVSLHSNIFINLKIYKQIQNFIIHNNKIILHVVGTTVEEEKIQIKKLKIFTPNRHFGRQKIKKKSYVLLPTVTCLFSKMQKKLFKKIKTKKAPINNVIKIR